MTPACGSRHSVSTKIRTEPPAVPGGSPGRAADAALAPLSRSCVEPTATVVRSRSMLVSGHPRGGELLVTGGFSRFWRREWCEQNAECYRKILEVVESLSVGGMRAGARGGGHVEGFGAPFGGSTISDVRPRGLQPPSTNCVRPRPSPKKLAGRRATWLTRGPTIEQ